MTGDVTQKAPHIRLDSLTGLRWWAAFAVFVYHFRNVGGFPGVNLALVGYTGVAFFFVLSGFVLTWSARPETTARQFWARRFARIWPAHFVALLVAIPVFYRFTPSPEYWWQKPWAVLPVVLSVVLLHGWSNSAQFLFAGNPASWTLACEAFFYGVHPAVNAALARVRSWGLPVVAVAATVIGTAMAVSGIAWPQPVARCWEFILGMTAALAIKRGVRVRLPMFVVYFTAAGIAVAYWALYAAGYAPTIAQRLPSEVWAIVLPVIYTAAIMVAATADIDGRRSLMRHRLMVIGGEWSYCFYLVHATVLYAAAEIMGTRSFGIVGFAAIFLASLLAAGLLHTVVEKPCERRIRRWADRTFGRKTPARA